MGKTKIEWVKNEDGTQGYTINPVKGLCLVACDYCYARRMYKRFKRNPEIRFEPIKDSDLPTKPSHIIIGSTMELFGAWVDAFWLDSIFRTVKDNPQHTFIFLTKRPENLIKWSPFPDNCWVGVSATNSEMARRGMTELDFIQAKVKFLSIEPLLNNDGYTPWEYIAFNPVNWVIIGQRTPPSKTTSPKMECVKEIVKACDKVRIPVFLKNNLRELLIPDALMDNIFWVDERAKLRQEFPR